MQGNIVTNTVPITSMLLDYVKTGHLESLHPDHVGPFLIRALRWRIITVSLLDLRYSFDGEIHTKAPIHRLMR